MLAHARVSPMRPRYVACGEARSMRAFAFPDAAALCRVWLVYTAGLPAIIPIVSDYNKSRGLLRRCDTRKKAATAQMIYLKWTPSELATLARMPEVRAEAQKASARPNDARTNAAMDRAFAAVEVKRPEIAGILNTPASQYFADITRQDPIYREILLTDRAGRLIASNTPTG